MANGITTRITAERDGSGFFGAPPIIIDNTGTMKPTPSDAAAAQKIEKLRGELEILKKQFPAASPDIVEKHLTPPEQK